LLEALVVNKCTDRWPWFCPVSRAMVLERRKGEAEDVLREVRRWASEAPYISPPRALSSPAPSRVGTRISWIAWGRGTSGRTAAGWRSTC
jgi:hypothetical protein